MGEITSPDEFMSFLSNDLAGIIDSVAQKLVEILEQKIEEIVYNPYEPTMYIRAMRDGGLLGMWDKTDAVINGDTIISEITEYPERMDVDSDGFFHGSRYWVLSDIREILTDIVVEGKSGNFFGEGFWRNKRDFWRPFIELLEDGTVDSMIEKEFRKRKLDFIKV